MSKVIIIGGGAAGSLAAIFAARNGHQDFLVEKNWTFAGDETSKCFYSVSHRGKRASD